MHASIALVLPSSMRAITACAGVGWSPIKTMAHHGCVLILRGQEPGTWRRSLQGYLAALGAKDDIMLGVLPPMAVSSLSS
jgi:hypothetical protein